MYVLCRGTHRMIWSRRIDLTSVHFIIITIFFFFLGHHTSWTDICYRFYALYMQMSIDYRYNMQV